MQIKFYGKMAAAFFVRVSVLSALVSTSAWAGSAGGSITFSPLGATSVPTLGTAALTLMALLIGFIAWVSMRKNGPGMVSSITLALAFVVGSGAGGLQWLQSAEAVLPASELEHLINNPKGQTLGVLPGSTNKYINKTNIPMQPTAINHGSCSFVSSPDSCALNSQLAPNEFCVLLCNSGNASDIRLKENIVRVATAANGLPLYEYSYRGDSAVYRGVMAQDVLNHTPAAVHTMSNGYYAVDYGMLNLELERIR